MAKGQHFNNNVEVKKSRIQKKKRETKHRTIHHSGCYNKIL